MVEGYSAETSGGILAILDEEAADAYVKEALEVYGHTVWKIGKVVEGSKQAMMSQNGVQVIQVNESPFP